MSEIIYTVRLTATEKAMVMFALGLATSNAMRTDGPITEIVMDRLQPWCDVARKVAEVEGTFEKS